MARGGYAHTGLARRGAGWRAWIVVLALALAGTTIAATICHEEHAADQDCAACLLRHQPAAELSGFLLVGSSDVPALLEQAGDGGWIASGHSRRLSARAPPARLRRS